MQGENIHNNYEKFKEISKTIFDTFEYRWNKDYENLSKVNINLKKALQGEKEAEDFFKEEVVNYLKDNDIGDIEYPPYYTSLVDAIYQENWGLCGIAEWFTEKYKESSSAKIIGEKIYFFDKGTANLMPQRIEKERRKQLVAKLLSIAPEERKSKDVNEIYLKDGTRVTIFNQSISKKDQDILVFRRYIIPEYTFEEQARRKTIPEEAIPLFLNQIKLGYNIAITGAVRTAKTTFLATWQRYENPSLEGLLIETDPEIPLHRLMPEAPIMQIVADDEQLKDVVKNLLRSDAEYMIMGEARNGVALDTAIRIANKGTRRCKMTFHNRFPTDFCYDVASEVVRTEGGDISLIAEKASQSWDYIFHFIQLANKNEKRLDGIFELTSNRQTGEVFTTQICKYREETDNWVWNYQISEEQREAGKKEDSESFYIFDTTLKELSEKFPMTEWEKRKAISVKKYRK